MLVHCRRCNSAVHLEESSAKGVCAYCGGTVELPTLREAGQDLKWEQDPEARQDLQLESPFRRGISWVLIAVGHFSIWLLAALPTSAAVGACVLLPIVALELAVWRRSLSLSAVQRTRATETSATREPSPHLRANRPRRIVAGAMALACVGAAGLIGYSEMSLVVAIRDLEDRIEDGHEENHFRGTLGALENLTDQGYYRLAGRYLHCREIQYLTAVARIEAYVFAERDPEDAPPVQPLRDLCARQEWLTRARADLQKLLAKVAKAPADAPERARLSAVLLDLQLDPPEQLAEQVVAILLPDGEPKCPSLTVLERFATTGPPALKEKVAIGLLQAVDRYAEAGDYPGVLRLMDTARRMDEGCDDEVLGRSEKLFNGCAERKDCRNGVVILNYMLSVNANGARRAAELWHDGLDDQCELSPLDPPIRDEVLRLRMDQVEEASRDGRYSEALSILEEAEKSAPSDMIAELQGLHDQARYKDCLERSDEAFAQGELEEARRWVEEAIEIVKKWQGGGLVVPTRAEQMLGKIADKYTEEGEGRVKQGCFEEALPLFNQALGISPDHEGAKEGRGDAYLGIARKHIKNGDELWNKGDRKAASHEWKLADKALDAGTTWSGNEDLGREERAGLEQRRSSWKSELEEEEIQKTLDKAKEWRNRNRWTKALEEVQKALDIRANHEEASELQEQCEKQQNDPRTTDLSGSWSGELPTIQIAYGRNRFEEFKLEFEPDPTKAGPTTFRIEHERQGEDERVDATLSPVRLRDSHNNVVQTRIHVSWKRDDQSPVSLSGTLTVALSNPAPAPGPQLAQAPAFLGPRVQNLPSSMRDLWPGGANINVRVDARIGIEEERHIPCVYVRCGRIRIVKTVNRPPEVEGMLKWTRAE